jgi:uncharacterized protein (DUF58 family)
VRAKFANPMKSSASGYSAGQARPWMWGSAEMWIRFLGALLGLGVAFGAALFSTVFRDSGNVWATVGLASVSLVLAVAFGLATVPYLAKRAAAERQRVHFEYAVTGVGIAYVLMTLVIAIAALNTGNNLLYIVVSAMLAAILVSGIASSIVLRGLRLDVRLPESVFAGQSVQARIVLRNTKRWFPSLSLRVVPITKSATDGDVEWQWEASTFAFPPTRWGWPLLVEIPDRRLRRRLVDASLPRIFEGMAYFPIVRAGAQVTAQAELTFARRGMYSDSGFAVATRFPFAFFTKTLKVKLERNLLVYPRLVALHGFAEMDANINGARESAAAGEGTDLYRIRNYQAGDSARQLDWKASAKTLSLMVREFSREDERKLRIFFANVGTGTLSTEDYENLVAAAASFAWQAAQHGSSAAFVGPSSQSSEDVYGFLGELAVILPDEPLAGSARDLAHLLGASDDDVWNVIVTSSASASSIPSHLPPHCSVIEITGPGQLRLSAR